MECFSKTLCTLVRKIIPSLILDSLAFLVSPDDYCLWSFHLPTSYYNLDILAVLQEILVLLRRWQFATSLARV